MNNNNTSDNDNDDNNNKNNYNKNISEIIIFLSKTLGERSTLEKKWQ